MRGSQSCIGRSPNAAGGMRQLIGAFLFFFCCSLSETRDPSISETELNGRNGKVPKHPTIPGHPLNLYDKLLRFKIWHLPHWEGRATLETWIALD